MNEAFDIKKKSHKSFVVPKSFKESLNLRFRSAGIEVGFIEKVFHENLF